MRSGASLPEVQHRLRVAQKDAHYGGGLVSGGRLMEMLSDAATELCVRVHGDEGLLAGYSSVEFLLPAYAGDFLEVTARLTARGRTSLGMQFTIERYAEPRPGISGSAVDLVDRPRLVLRASGTCVVPERDQRH